MVDFSTGKGPKMNMFDFRAFQEKMHKLGCVVRMVVDSILPHAESGPNDHRKDAPPFIAVRVLNISF